MRPTPPRGLPSAPPEDAHAAALDHALLAAGRGYPVIPLTRSKLPAIRSPHRGHPEVPPCRGECGRLGHGVHDASTDPLTVRRMFAAAPWAIGYGLACGLPPHHLIGIDLDTKNGADGLTALRFLAEQHGFPIPPTVTVLTPSGGRHLWFTGPPAPPVPNSVGRIAPGIDIRGAGGYLVGPGSLTAHGRYALAPGSPQRPAPVPSALLTLLTAPPPSAHRESPAGVSPQPAAALVRFVRASPPGQRNARLFWAACRAYDSGLGQELTARLTEAARHTGLSAQEARATITSAARRRQG
ncbi:bifunctional DNA primase/polymerase [Streptomyces decoyicus]|uniref:bifunctional DNA primase/polymerase n=1 Tax=Streptomyces decoyicus TaxID=249567 RepID=UPI00386B63E3|nr:bifunctional DNA primase/polymerase [Streptomyces decoyicus]